MKKIVSFAFILGCLFLVNCTSSDDTVELKVLQINLWHGTSVVPGGFEGLVHLIEQTDPDVVLFSEVQHPQRPDLITLLTDTLQTLGRVYYGEPVTRSAGMISKYKIEEQVLCCHSDIQGPMTKTYIRVGGHTLAIYSSHLDYTHYECYLPRGYSGTSWEKLDAPVTDADSVLRANRLSERDETIADFIKDAKAEVSKGNLVLLGGDFNEPSHLDWQADTKELRDHNGVVIKWDCSVMLTEMGMIDSYREQFPDAVTHPGFTFPSANPSIEVSKLTWAPEADERDRIDFIYYYPNAAWSLKETHIVGPEETVAYGKVVEKDADDFFITPEGIWPTDHKGNLATFIIRKE